MATRFDLVKDINAGSEHKLWRMKVRVIRLWNVRPFNETQQSPSIEMVVIDEECQRIQCSIRSHHVKYFENEIVEGNAYSFFNFAVALNSAKYKPTNHEFRIFFKKETIVRLIEDSVIPMTAFEFVPNSVICNERKQDSRLVDVIGLLTGKGDLNTWTKEEKSANYLELELDDLESPEKLRCTLWEEFANQLLNYVKQNPAAEYIIILQFAKMKYYRGAMGVSNTNFNSKLFINANLPQVSQFKLRIPQSDYPGGTQVSQLESHPPYSLEDDFLEQSIYKPISELKDVHENANFVTIGTVKDIESESSWWYKSCKTCYQGLKEDVRSFYCRKCEAYPTTFVPRYSIKFRVVDETDSASFIIHDKEAAKFLNTSTSDLRSAHLARGGSKTSYPEELNSFKDKTFLFKVSLKVEDLNSFQPCVITVIKLCSNESIISAFIEKYKVDEGSLFTDLTQSFSHAGGFSDFNKDDWSQTFENTPDFEAGSSTTPSKPVVNDHWVAKASEFSPCQFDESSTKLRKVIKEQE